MIMVKGKAIRDDKEVERMVRREHYRKVRDRELAKGRRVWSNNWVTNNERLALRAVLDTMRDSNDSLTPTGVIDWLISRKLKG